MDTPLAPSPQVTPAPDFPFFTQTLTDYLATARHTHPVTVTFATLDAARALALAIDSLNFDEWTPALPHLSDALEQAADGTLHAPGVVVLGHGLRPFATVTIPVPSSATEETS